jgi:hypothetical protein
MQRRALLSMLAGALVLLGACGGGDGDTASGPSAADRLTEVERATAATLKSFPSAEGRTLQEVADRLDPGPQVALATEAYTPGRNRLGFGLLDAENRFVYGPAAVYVGTSPDARALGPFAATADSLITDPPFRSRNQAAEDDRFASIYATDVPFGRPGRWEVLVATRLGGKLLGNPAAVRVVRKERDPVPAIGERAPVVETETVSSAAGDMESIETRVPADDMHDVSFSEVVGRKPVALLFASPALCESRVCGPVVDIAAQLQKKYGDRIEFIHQEPYVDNDPNKGFRPPLRSFGVHTEPWLFTTGRDGRVAARLEGSFGLATFDRAVQAALR